MNQFPYYLPVPQQMLINGQLVPGFQAQQLPPQFTPQSPTQQFTPQSPSQAPHTPEKPKKKPFQASSNKGPTLVFDSAFENGTLQMNVCD